MPLGRGASTLARGTSRTLSCASSTGIAVPWYSPASRISESCPLKLRPAANRSSAAAGAELPKPWLMGRPASISGRSIPMPSSRPSNDSRGFPGTAKRSATIVSDFRPSTSAIE